MPAFTLDEIAFLRRALHTEEVLSGESANGIREKLGLFKGESSGLVTRLTMLERRVNRMEQERK